MWNGVSWEASDENIFKELEDVNTELALKLDANGLDMAYLASTGLLSGGVITPTGGVNFSVSDGDGSSYNNGIPTKVTWTGITGAAIAPGNNYISIDENGLLNITASYPDDNKIKLGFIYTDDMNASILGFSDLAPKVENLAQQIQNFYRRALGTLVTNGTQVVEQIIPNQLKLIINSGEKFAQGIFKSFTQTDNFTKFIQTSDNGFVVETGSPANIVNVNQYNDTTQPEVSALVNMTTGYWKKDLILRAPNGLVLYIYGDSEWATEEEAKKAPLPNYPDSVRLGSVKLASIVVEQGSTSIANGISDLRPILSRIFDVGLNVSLATAVDHGALIGLGDDDHPQYLNETRGDVRYYRVTNPNGFETPSQLNSRDTANRVRANHTGTQLANTISDLQSAITNNTEVLTNTAKVSNATHTGDVTGDTVLTIANNAVTNAKAAQMNNATIKGRATAGTGNAEDLSATQVRALLNVANGATANDTDVNLKNRANHTGTQTSSTISDFASTVRATILTGLSTASSALVTAGDSILTAIGKLQAQVLVDKFGLAETATVVISGTAYVQVGGMTYTAKKTGTARISFTCTRLHSSSGIADGIGIFINGTSSDIRTVTTFSNERHAFAIELDGVAINVGDVISIGANDNGAGTHSIFGRNLSVNIVSNSIILT